MNLLMFLTPAQSIPIQMMDGPALHIGNTDTEAKQYISRL